MQTLGAETAKAVPTLSCTRIRRGLLTAALMGDFFFCRFCVGDKFFLKNNMILCQMDYEEGQLNGSFETQVQ